MGSYRFVDPGETVRLELPPRPDGDGRPDWIDVKKYLTAGERKRLDGAGVPTMLPGGKDGQVFGLDFERLGLGRLEIYLVAWSFTDRKGNQTKPERSTIAALNVDTVKEIDALLDAHVKRMEEEKNGRAAGAAGTGPHATSSAMCRFMRWSWHDLMATPVPVVDALREWMVEIAAEDAKQRAEIERKRGRRR